MPSVRRYSPQSTEVYTPFIRSSSPNRLGSASGVGDSVAVGCSGCSIAVASTVLTAMAVKVASTCSATLCVAGPFKPHPARISRKGRINEVVFMVFVIRVGRPIEKICSNKLKCPIDPSGLFYIQRPNLSRKKASHFWKALLHPRYYSTSTSGQHEDLS